MVDFCSIRTRRGTLGVIALSVLLTACVTVGVLYAGNNTLFMGDTGETPGCPTCTNTTIYQNVMIYQNETIYVNNTEYVPEPHGTLAFSVNTSYPFDNTTTDVVNFTSASALVVYFTTDDMLRMNESGDWGNLGNYIAAMAAVNVTRNYTCPYTLEWCVPPSIDLLTLQLTFSVHWSNGSDVAYTGSLLDVLPITSCWLHNCTRFEIELGALHYDGFTVDYATMRVGDTYVSVPLAPDEG